MSTLTLTPCPNPTLTPPSPHPHPTHTHTHPTRTPHTQTTHTNHTPHTHPTRTSHAPHTHPARTPQLAAGLLQQEQRTAKRLEETLSGAVATLDARIGAVAAAAAAGGGGAAAAAALENAAGQIAAQQASLEGSLARAATAATAAAVSTLESVLSGLLQKALSTQVLPPLQRGQEAIAATAASELPAAIGVQMAPVVREAFKASFAQELLPGYQRASAKMFEDLHGTLTAALDATSQKTAAILSEHKEAVGATHATLSADLADRLGKQLTAVAGALYLDLSGQSFVPCSGTKKMSLTLCRRSRPGALCGDGERGGGSAREPS